jgi:enamine deaminase RidA (YjgF/YER057c/UK114 family)
MTRRRITQGSSFEEAFAYSRAVVDGNWVFVSGTTGYDYSTMTIADDIESQTRQMLENVDRALTEAGVGRDDIVRVRYYLPNASEFDRCRTQLRAFFEGARPAATMIQAGLIDDRIKIEIEVTARRHADGRA